MFAANSSGVVLYAEATQPSPRWATRRKPACEPQLPIHSGIPRLCRGSGNSLPSGAAPAAPVGFDRQVQLGAHNLIAGGGQLSGNQGNFESGHLYRPDLDVPPRLVYTDRRAARAFRSMRMPSMTTADKLLALLLRLLGSA